MIARILRRARILLGGPAGRRSAADSPPNVRPPLPVALVASEDQEGLAGKVAMIVGAGPNIGRGMALALAAAGADLILVDRREEALTALAKELTTYRVRVDTHLVDISRGDGCDTLLRATEQAGAIPDILILNVGMGGDTLANPARFQALEAIFRTNVIGPAYLADRTARAMVQRGRGGSVIFVTSIHQWTPRSFHGYSATKAALGMIVHEMALHFGPGQVRVNGLAPGWVAEGEDGLPKLHPPTALYGMSVTPRAIGAAAVFLASDALSGHITGVVLPVDGGLSLHSYLTARAQGRRR